MPYRRLMHSLARVLYCSRCGARLSKEDRRFYGLTCEACERDWLDAARGADEQGVKDNG